MKSKNFFILLISLIIIIFSFIIIFNFFLDPYFILRNNKRLYTEYRNSLSRYQNAGLINNLSARNYIIGTSIVENIAISDFNKILDLKNTVKLIITGSSAKEYLFTLDYLLKKNKDIENIYIEIDPFNLFAGPVDRERYGYGTFPSYLYKENNNTKLKYLLDKRVIYLSLERLKNHLRYGYSKNIDMFDNMYSHQRESLSLEDIFSLYKNKNLDIDLKTISNDYSIDTLKLSFDTNIEKILLSNSDVKFHLFFPSNSILFYKKLESNNYLDKYYDIKKYIIKKSLKYSNVDIYDFGLDANITNNLNNFDDLRHYKTSVNILILNNLKRKNFLMKEYNYQDILNNNLKKIKYFQIEKKNLF